MDEIKEPTPWRRPRSKVYDFNQEFGGSYYQPMLNYLNSKERQGPFFERPTERIHLPDPMETIIAMNKVKTDSDYTSRPGVDKFLVQSYAQQIKEQNMSTVKTKSMMLKNSTSMKNLSHTKTNNQNTFFDDIRLMKGEPPGRRMVNHYTRELGCMKVAKDWQTLCTHNHMLNVASGIFDCSSSNYGQGGTPMDQQFYDEKLIKKVVDSIKFKNPERVLPVI